jgi:hypothetical protein
LNLEELGRLELRSGASARWGVGAARRDGLPDERRN